MKGRVPSVPTWVRWVLRLMMSRDDVRAALSELEELYRGRVSEGEVRDADRWYRRQVRQYPFQLLAQRARRRRRGGDGRRAGSLGGPSEPIGTLIRNLVHSARALVRVPTLTGAVILTVGLGIGGCTAIFAVVDALFLRALPYPESDQLTRIYTDAPPSWYRLSAVDFQALEAQQTVFEHVAAYTRGSRTLTASDVAERILVTSVTPGLFTTLGVPPVSGRTFLPEDGVEGAEETVMITESFGLRYLGTSAGGSPAVGRLIHLDGVAARVVGVLPSDHGPLLGTAEVFSVLRLGTPTRRGPFRLDVIGRLRPGMELEAAAQELHAINRRVFPLWADSYQDERSSWSMMSLREMLNRDAAQLVLIISGAVGFLLLISATNATNLMLARVGGRRTELAVRAALGASRRQLVAFLLAESALLAAGGAVVGLATARGAIALLPVVASSYIPRLQEVALNGPVLAFAGILALGSALLFGLLPALHGSSAGLARELRSGGRAGTASGRQQRYHRMLVTAQLAVAVPLLTGAGLLASSFAKLQRIDAGFDAESLLSVRVSLAAATYPKSDDRLAFWDRLTERVAALPGVSSVGRSSLRPPDAFGDANNFDLEDAPTPPGESQPAVPWVIADAGFFESLGIRLVAGRMFNEADLDTSAPPVALVDQAWARRFFPEAPSVGRRFKSGGCTWCAWTTVVGVVADVSYEGIGNEGRGAVYQPDRNGLRTPYLNVRTAGDPVSLMPALRQEVRRLDAAVPLTQMETGETLLKGSVAQPRHLMWLLTGFSGLALLLAMIGLYGITAHSVQRQKGDIAIRVALGGTSSVVLRMIVGRAMVLVAVGLVAGLGTALGVTRVLSNLLYDVSPTDPWTLAAVAALLASVALVASILPARRALHVDPASALRAE